MSAGTVLVLEDSRVQAQLISRMLARLGWTSVLSFNHRTTFATLRTEPVDLLLLDVYVEGGNTLMHLPEIRQLSPSAPVAIMTAGEAGGLGLSDTLNAARHAQADFVLQKPFRPEDMAAILDAAALMQGSPVRVPHVLVVDDNRVVRKLAQKALSAKGYRISEASSMEEAFERIDVAHVDVVLTDIFMPGMGGIEGIQIIRATWPEVSIIAMSAGLEQKVDHRQALWAAGHSGADAQLPKPFTASDLTYLVEVMMSEKYLAA